MVAWPFDDASLDAIRAEGATCHVGFELGMQAWRRFVKPGGALADRNGLADVSAA